MRLSGSALFGLCLLWSSIASAQLMGARELKTGVPAKGVASAKPVAELFYLAGESGARESYTLTIKGPASITIYSPGGHEMLTAAGSGTVKLDVVLPFTDVFTIAVARKDAKQPYTLSRKASVPTLAEAVMAEAVGFYGGDVQKQCWVIPGVKVHIEVDGATEDYTLAADRSTITWVRKSAKGMTTGETLLSIEGEQIKRKFLRSDGIQESKGDLDLAYAGENLRGFSGYLCNDAR